MKFTALQRCMAMSHAFSELIIIVLSAYLYFQLFLALWKIFMAIPSLRNLDENNCFQPEVIEEFPRRKGKSARFLLALFPGFPGAASSLNRNSARVLGWTTNLYFFLKISDNLARFHLCLNIKSILLNVESSVAVLKRDSQRV